MLAMRQLKLKLIIFATCIGVVFVGYSFLDYHKKSLKLWRQVQIYTDNTYQGLDPSARQHRAEALYMHLSETVKIDYLLANPDEIGKVDSTLSTTK